MPARARRTTWVLAWACPLTLAVAAVFYARGWAASGGEWPAPLDDVYIHFDFARSLAHGHPFEWIAGQGYSAGETAPAYACVLAVGYALGFHGAWLGAWAAAIACASLMFVAWALSRLARPAPIWASWLAAPLLFACATLDFAWWSGMEVASFAGAAAALLLVVDHARRSGQADRSRRQWGAGLLGALLVLLRPEGVVVVAVASFVVARHPGRGSPVAAGGRVALPGAAATLAMAALHHHFTGSLQAAGARLKLLSSNPFSTDEDRARDYLVNLGSLFRTLTHDLGDLHGRFAWGIPVLAVCSLASRRTRSPGVLCLASAFAYVLLASLNGAARFQNFRDYAPAVALTIFAATLGIAALSRHRVLRVVGAGLAVLSLALGLRHVPEGVRFFARASENIHDQQVEVGRRIARDTPADAVVLLGDAGAIPYFSGRHAVDALGLGGYHGAAFVEAAVHGEAATLELIERLAPHERPTILALYPSWFPGITRRFGRQRDAVTLDDNVICGGATKGIYDADWSAMRPDATAPDDAVPGVVLDEVDVADVVSEAAHRYVSPAPTGGWTLFDVRSDGRVERRFDAGRVIPRGQAESFVLAASGGPSGATLLVRTDDTPFDARVVVRAKGCEAPLVPTAPASKDRWGLARAALRCALQSGDVLELDVTGGSLHDFHAWLVQEKR